MKPLKLLAPLLGLCLQACGPTQPVISTPPPERFSQVAEPPIPAGDSDAEVSGYIVSLIDALRKANGELAWLDDWRKGVTAPPH